MILGWTSRVLAQLADGRVVISRHPQTADNDLVVGGYSVFVNETAPGQDPTLWSLADPSFEYTALVRVCFYGQTIAVLTHDNRVLIGYNPTLLTLDRRPAWTLNDITDCAFGILGNPTSIQDISLTYRSLV